MDHTQMDIAYHFTWVDEKHLTHNETITVHRDHLTVGRSPKSDVIVSHPSVSRAHAHLSWQNNLLTIIDANSRFGTYCNGKPVSSEQGQVLYDKGELRFGSLSVWFEMHTGEDDTELLQTCYFQPAEAQNEKLSEELSVFKTNLLQTLRIKCDNNAFADQIEASIEKELRILNQKHETQLREQRVLNSISHILNKCHSTQELATQSLELLSKVLDAQRGYVLLVDEKKSNLTLIGHRNFNSTQDEDCIEHAGHYSRSLIKHCISGKDIFLIKDSNGIEMSTSIGMHSPDLPLSIVTIPLLHKNNVIGVIYLDSPNPHCFSEKQKPFLKTFAAHTSIALNNIQLYKRAVTDDLTQLYTRSYIDERLCSELDRAVRYQRPFSVLIIDIDHFKSINDTYGHSAGDRVLQRVSSMLIHQLRDTDIAGRLGGEEFIIVLGETDEQGALMFAERIREAILQMAFKENEMPIKITVSVGVASYNSQTHDDHQVIIDDADKALYKAKLTGRNRVISAQ